MRSSIMGVALVCVITSWVLPLTDAAAEDTLRLVVRPAAPAGSDVPVSAEVALPKDLADVPAEELRVQLRPEGAGSAEVPGQIVKAGEKTQLWWVLPKVEAGAEQRWTASISRGKPDPKQSFTFKDNPGEYLDLLDGGRPVTRYMYAFDTSTAERKSATWKTYHHVFDAAGEDVITQGAGGRQYGHHRGLFIGGSIRVQNGPGGDFWHGQHQLHQESLEQFAGPVLARSCALIHWETTGGDLVLVEQRETTAYRQPSSTMLLLDFCSRLKGPDGDVTFSGDREHGGMQFRAHGDIDAGQTQYLFPKEDTDVRGDRDLPWAAMSFVLRRDGEERYSVQHMNHPRNPENTEHSAYRNYGRFGAFFRTVIKSGETLEVRYRIWVLPGEMPARETMQAKWEAFAHPPQVEVVR
jgi:hypothetical protein